MLSAAVQHLVIVCERVLQHSPLLRLLELGCTIVGVTGSKLETHRRLFFDSLPLEARRAGRVLMAVETGKRLYRCGPDGDVVEDRRFAAFSDAKS